MIIMILKTRTCAMSNIQHSASVVESQGKALDQHTSICYHAHMLLNNNNKAGTTTTGVKDGTRAVLCSIAPRNNSGKKNLLLKNKQL